jgi:hypothetical protein
MCRDEILHGCLNFSEQWVRRQLDMQVCFYSISVELIEKVTKSACFLYFTEADIIF